MAMLDKYCAKSEETTTPVLKRLFQVSLWCIAAATPSEVIARLNHEIDLYLSGPDVEERLLTLGLSTDGGGTPESTAQVISREQEQWRAFGKELNIEPQ